MLKNKIRKIILQFSLGMLFYPLGIIILPKILELLEKLKLTNTSYINGLFFVINSFNVFICMLAIFLMDKLIIKDINKKLINFILGILFGLFGTFIGFIVSTVISEITPLLINPSINSIINYLIYSIISISFCLIGYYLKI